MNEKLKITTKLNTNLSTKAIKKEIKLSEIINHLESMRSLHEDIIFGEIEDHSDNKGKSALEIEIGIVKIIFIRPIIIDKENKYLIIKD